MAAVEKQLGPYLFEDIYRVEQQRKNQIAVWFAGKEYTYGDIERSVDYYATFLSHQGVKQGDHVALLSVNSFNWLIAFYAIIRVGAVAVLLNYMARHEALVSHIIDTNCAYLCLGPYTARRRRAGEYEALLKETSLQEENIFSIDPHEKDLKQAAFAVETTPFESPFSREEESKRTSYIIFTTGTTSKPKPAMLNQYAMMNTIYLNLCALDPVFPQKFMCLLPMFHCFGLLVVNGYLAYGRTVYLNTLLDKVQIYKEFMKNRCGDYASVGIVFSNLAKTPLWWLHRGRFVKHCIVGGGFTSREEFRFLERKYGKGKILNGYGQTECSPLVSLVYPDAPKEKKMTTVGTLMKGIEVAFMDPTTKELLPAGKQGEILVKGYVVFNGYYNLPKEEQPFDENGYLHTGDLGYLDEEGYLVLTGRIKDIIIRKGENISPMEIEQELRKFPEFTDARVLGFPSIDEGEYIIGCVEMPKKPLHFNEDIYLNQMRKTLPSIKIPTHIIYVRRFPRNANGKLDEAALREVSLTKIAKFLNDEVLAKKTRTLIAEAEKNKRS